MAKKKKVYLSPKSDPTSFLFTSLMLILLTFFIVLSSMGVQDGQKQRIALNSLMGSFGILPGGRSPYKNTGGIDLLPQSAPIRESVMDIKKIRATLTENGIISGMGISQGSMGVTITMKSGVLFKPGSDAFSEESNELLNSLVKVISQIDNNVIITGHTDSIPLEGPPYYSNWGLSAARALAVVTYLANRGISPERLSAYGLGAQRPITSNSTEYGRRLNRRVEITLLGDLGGDVDISELNRTDHEPIRTFQYRGYKFKLEEQ